MTTAEPILLSQKWKARLDLSGRGVPEFYERAEAVGDTPHAGAIRVALTEVGISAVFCVQGVPTIAILVTDDYKREQVIDLHAALWNQGLASLFLVISGDTVRAFSLARKPHVGSEGEFDRHCLIETLDATTDALALRNLVYGAESGRLWIENSSYFGQKERIDQVLLRNLSVSHQLLCDANLSSDAAQALLIQTMFIAYLEDRGVTNQDHFLDATNGIAENFLALLEAGDPRFLTRLFKKLRAEINGDLFVAPCSFEAGTGSPRVTHSHLEIIARFRSGREAMSQSGGQIRFWGYNFKYIPIELISAVYDRFLGEREAERRDQGAYYTPMFLADTVISQVWDSLPSATKDKGHFLDPACGSGIFLVRCFQRLCENWRVNRKSQSIPWRSLLAILSRLHGWDLNGGSVRVAVFSLYIALLEEVSPPDIRNLAKRGKMLPELWGKNLRCQDFFTVPTDVTRFDVIIGNPPWTSRRRPNRSSVKWCAEVGLPMPGKEEAWAFVWKSLRHLRDNGVVAFLLPAMGFLHNHADSSIAARSRLINEARIWRIINFADLRRQLFKGAVGPTALMILGRGDLKAPPYRFDYWVPKADLNLKLKRLITLSSVDKSSIRSNIATTDPLIFKRRLWMGETDAKLFNYLSALPKISNIVSEYGDLKRRKQETEGLWIIGQGFKPANKGRLLDSGYEREHSEIVATTPYLPISAFNSIAQGARALKPWKDGNVHRKGFESGFFGPRILVPQGVSTSQMRLRASYAEKPLTFQHSIQAIVVPHGEESRAKLLTALLCSRVAIWFAFHGTGCFGSERPKVLQADLVRLPFPSSQDLPKPEQAQRAAKALVQIIDTKLEIVNGPFTLQSDNDRIFMEIDRLAYEYFCLSDDEIILIEDAVEKRIPAVQPSQGSFLDIWKPAERVGREAYANTLVRSLQDWFDDDCVVQIVLEACNADMAVLRLTLRESRKQVAYVEESDRSVGESLSRLFEHIHQPLSGNFQLMPDFRLFVGNCLYLVKPIQQRFWLRSTALADADAIALDLQDAIEFRERWDQA